MGPELPEGWELRPLADCGRWLSGGTPPKSEPTFWGGDIPWVGPKDLHVRYVDDAEEYVTRLGATNGTRLAPANSVLIVVRSMSLAKGLQVALTRRELAFNQDIKAILPAGDVHPRFLLYALWGSHDALHVLVDEASHGTKRLRTDVLAQFPLPLPPWDEQERIVAVLGALDDKIDSNRRLEQRLDATAEELFRHAEREADSHGKEPLGRRVTLTPGRSYASADLDDPESANGLLTLKCVRAGGGFAPSGVRRYAGRYKPAQVASPGDIIVAHTDLTQRATVLGRPAIVRNLAEFDQLVACMHVPIVRPDLDLPASYLYYLLRSDAFHEHAYARSHGSTVLMLNKKALGEYMISFPKPPTLAAFDDAVAPMLAHMSALASEAERLGEVRDLLLPRLISGEIRVPDGLGSDDVGREFATGGAVV